MAYRSAHPQVIAAANRRRCATHLVPTQGDNGLINFLDNMLRYLFLTTITDELQVCSECTSAVTTKCSWVRCRHSDSLAWSL